MREIFGDLASIRPWYMDAERKILLGSCVHLAIVLSPVGNKINKNAGLQKYNHFCPHSLRKQEAREFSVFSVTGTGKHKLHASCDKGVFVKFSLATSAPN